MIKCRTCGETSVIKVAEKGNLDFFSCCNEECGDYAELLVEVNGGYEHVYKMLNAYKQIVDEITNEKNQVPRS